MPDASLKDALDLQREAGLIDLHLDSIIQQRLFGYAVDRRHRAGIGGQPLFWHADVPRMDEAAYGGACMGIHYFPWESEGGWREMNAQIDYLDKLAAGNDRLVRIREPADWDKARVDGKMGMQPGVEGAHMLNGKLERVAELAERHVAYLTLTHFSKNKAATPAMGRGSNERDGLTDFGRELVTELNRVGIVVDVAHVNTPGVLDVLKVTKAPVLCTHTGVKGVHKHARNISDAEIDGIAAGGGTIGIMFAPGFLAGKYRADSEIVLDHLDYIIDRVGVDHAALGSDYDGWLPSICSDHHDCRDITRVTAGLLRRGHSGDDVAKILWGNAMRVMGEAWAVRRS